MQCTYGDFRAKMKYKKRYKKGLGRKSEKK